jgi:1-acyl-sn-glycerol-3-phosphate acyltransferase
MTAREHRKGAAAGTAVYRIGHALARVAVGLLARARVEAASNVPRTGGLLVVANHTSLVDPVLLAALFPRPLVFLAKRELFAWAPLRFVFHAAGVIPIQRGRADRRALDQACGVLAAGGAVLVFAEGTRSREGALGVAEAGVGLLAARSRAPVLPVALVGTDAYHHLAGWLSRPRLAVRVGAPRCSPVTERRGSAPYREFADLVMRDIAVMLPPRSRGAYADGPDGISAEPARPPAVGRSA